MRQPFVRLVQQMTKPAEGIGQPRVLACDGVFSRLVLRQAVTEYPLCAQELLEQRLFGHLRMRLGTTRLFVDLRLNTVEAACRNVYVVTKTVFLKLRCGMERITKEFAGFFGAAYIIGGYPGHG